MLPELKEKKVYKNKQNQGGEGQKIRRSENLTEEKAQAIEELDIFLLF